MSACRYVRCPDNPVPITSGHDPDRPIVGCGRSFAQKPDDEGWVDCPYCGLGFNPGPENVIQVS